MQYSSHVVGIDHVKVTRLVSKTLLFSKESADEVPDGRACLIWVSNGS